jgi:HSP20 family protein
LVGDPRKEQGSQGGRTTYDTVSKGGTAMTIERRNPQKGLTVRQPDRAMEEMGRYFEDVFGRPFLPAAWSRVPTEDLVWAPSIEVVEKEDKFLVKAELPGVKEEDINISLSGNVLTIDGEKKTESEERTKGYYYSESSYGSFSRSMAIPSTIDASKIEANYDKGVLEITLPKTPEVKPKKIKLAVKKKEEAVSKKK